MFLSRRGARCWPATQLRPRSKHPPYTRAMDAMDRVLASMSADDTIAALRSLKVLEECRQMDATEDEEWRRRFTGWARFNAVGATAEPSA